MCTHTFLPKNLVFLLESAEHGHSHSHTHGSRPNSASPSKAASIASDEGTTLAPPSEPPQYRGQSPPVLRKTRERSESYSSLYGHPAATRASLVQTAADMARERSPQPVGPRRTRSHSRPLPSVESQRSFGAGSTSRSALDAENEDAGAITPTVAANERTALLTERHDGEDDNGDHADGSFEQGHSHGHDHAHGSMNMRGILLHVLGDALGNVGVIATGLIIWLTSWSFKFYFDPIISLVITVIIFQSALPLGGLRLVRSSNLILIAPQSAAHLSSCSRVFRPRSRSTKSATIFWMYRVYCPCTSCTYGSSRNPRSSRQFTSQRPARSTSCPSPRTSGVYYTRTAFTQARSNLNTTPPPMSTLR